MSRRYYSSTFVSTTTSGSILATDTSVTLASAAGLPASTPWTGVFERGTSNEDLVTVTNVSGSTLTITRGVDGQTAKAHASGVAFDHVVSARDFDEPNNHINTTTRDDHTQYAKAGQGLAANVGAASRAGRLYIATDTEDLYSDDGTTVHRYLSKPSSDAAYRAVGSFAAVRKTAAQTVTSSTVYVDDTELKFAIAASQTWVATFVVFADGVQSADIKFQITGPAGSNISAALSALDTPATSNSGNLIAYSAAGTASVNLGGVGTVNSGGVATVPVTIYVSVLNGGTPGNITLQWAQNVSNATGSSVLAGSFLTATKVG